MLLLLPPPPCTLTPAPAHTSNRPRPSAVVRRPACSRRRRRGLVRSASRTSSLARKRTRSCIWRRPRPGRSPRTNASFRSRAAFLTTATRLWSGAGASRCLIGRARPRRRRLRWSWIPRSRRFGLRRHQRSTARRLLTAAPWDPVGQLTRRRRQWGRLPTRTRRHPRPTALAPRQPSTCNPRQFRCSLSRRREPPMAPVY
jgi:hypothetical protein